ncbi:unnamed protein product, partial [Ixodes hexagonus]
MPDAENTWDRASSMATQRETERGRSAEPRGRQLGTSSGTAASDSNSERADQVQINTKKQCNTKHRTQYAPCENEVIYNIPLTCGRCYIGQTGRCINDRAREHAANLRNLAGPGHLAAHCRTCLCEAELEHVRILGHHKNQVAREVLEALAIDEEDEKCVSTPSITL